MSLGRTIARNVISNWVGYAVQAFAAFLLTPYVLRSLGEARYGVWTLAQGLTGYYGLLDLGISSGIGLYLTRYFAQKDFESLNKTASTGFFALLACGGFVCACSLLVAAKAATLFQIPQHLYREVALVIVITALSVALQFTFNTYSAVFTAAQRYDLSNAIGIATRLLSVASVVLTLKLGYGLVGISIALAVSNLIDYLIRWRVARYLLPMMKVSLDLFSRSHLGETAKIGLWSLLAAGGVRLILYTDTFVIAAFLPISAVAPFAIAASLRTYFDDIFVRAGYVFFPAVTQLDAQGDRIGLQQLYLVGSRFMFLGAIWCGVTGFCLADPFFRLWLGAEFAQPTRYPPVSLIFWVLLAASMVTVGQRIGYQVLMGTRRFPLMAVLFGVEGAANLILSVVLVTRVGLIGVAWGTLIPAVICQGMLQPFFVCRALDISIRTYCSQVLLRPALALLAIFPAVLIITRVARADSWVVLVADAVLGAAITAPVVVIVGGLTAFLGKVEFPGWVRLKGLFGQGRI